MNREEPTTKGTEAGPQGADDDVETDPAMDTESGSDWSGEGGATPAGPSTDTER